MDIARCYNSMVRFRFAMISFNLTFYNGNVSSNINTDKKKTLYTRKLWHKLIYFNSKSFSFKCIGYKICDFLMECRNKSVSHYLNYRFKVSNVKPHWKKPPNSYISAQWLQIIRVFFFLNMSEPFDNNLTNVHSIAGGAFKIQMLKSISPLISTSFLL